MTGDALEELIASAGPPLRFLRDADPTQRARTSLPLQAWLARVATLRRAQPAAVQDGLAQLEAALTALAAAPPAPDAEQVRLATAALAALGALRGASAAAPAREAAVPEVPALPAAPARKRPRAAAREEGAEPAKPAPQPAPAAAPSASRAQPETPPQTPAAHGGAAPDASVADVERWLGAASQPTTSVAGVGPSRAAELERFGLKTVEDLLYHLPFRYDDRRSLRRAGELRLGDTVTTVLEIRRVDQRQVGKGGRRQVLSAIAGDETGTVELLWYNQIRWFRSRLKPGGRWLVHGRVEKGYDFALRIVHPELESADDDAAAGPPRVVPVYEKPTTMPVATMRRIVHAAVDANARLLPDTVPRRARARYGLLPLAAALLGVHRPDRDAAVDELATSRSPEHRSIVFDELFFVQLGLLLRKAQVAREPGIAFDGPGALPARMIGGAAVPAHRGAGARHRGDRRRPAGRAPDAPPAAGGRRQRQDGGRRRGGAARDRVRLAGGHHGADRAARRAALEHGAARRRRAGGEPLVLDG